MTTVFSESIVEPGDELHDNIVVNGLPLEAEVEVESTLWGPFDSMPQLGDTIPKDAPKVGTVTTRVTGAQSGQTIATESLVVSGSGYYSWTDQFKETKATAAWKSQFGVVAETAVSKWKPAITTKTSMARAEVTNELSDFLYVSGSKPGEKLRVTSTLWGPFDEKPTFSDTVPAGAPKVAEVVTITTGDGTYETPSITIPDVGWYAWTEESEATEHQEAWISPFGVESELTYADPYSGGGGGEDPPSGGGGGDKPLPQTGANVRALVAASGGLLIAGAIAAWASRGRKRKSA